MKFNLSEGFVNSSQRNNQFQMTKGNTKMNGSSMCNVTSIIMALEYSGWVFPEGKYEQPEDNLCQFICNDKEVLDYYKIHFPAMYAQWDRGDKNAYWPNEVHKVLEFGVNKWLGCSKADVFNEGMLLRGFCRNLYQNKIPMPTSMTFGRLGHIICVVGVDIPDWSEENFKEYLLSKCKCPSSMSFIYDDPYGYCTNFSLGTYDGTKSGNDNRISVSDFIKYSKPINHDTIMCHTIGKPAAVV